MSSVVVHELYTGLAEATEELSQRRTNDALRSRVEQYFSAHPILPLLSEEPSAVYAPSLVSPNLELLRLLSKSNSLGLPLKLLEYSHDKFVHINYVKRCLGRMTFIDDSDGNWRVVERLDVVDFQKAQGKPMHEVMTTSGENLVAFHHRLLRSAVPRAPHVTDFSDWFQSSKSFAAQFPYLRFLGLFLTDGILLANFTTEKREVLFTEQVVLPAFRKLREDLGVRPLIVPVSPPDSDDSDYWNYYPIALRAYC